MAWGLSKWVLRSPGAQGACARAPLRPAPASQLCGSLKMHLKAEPTTDQENRRTAGPGLSPHSLDRWGDGGHGGEGLGQGRSHPRYPASPLGFRRQGLCLGLSDVSWILVNKLVIKRPSPPFALPPRAVWDQSGARERQEGLSRGTHLALCPVGPQGAARS